MRDVMCKGVAGLAVLAALGAAGAAVAADFPQRTALAARSAGEGLGRPRVPLLKREAGSGASATLDALSARFSASPGAVNTRGAAERLEKSWSVALRGGGWLLQVYADGTKVTYRNYDALAGAESLGRPVAERMSTQVLESLGRRFIAERLAGLVNLGPGEDLVPLFTEHEINGTGPVDPGAGPVVEQVTASRIVFGRSVGGVNVIGPGSKVSVLFTNDGEAAGFDYDWPSYQATDRQQDVLGIAQVRQRARGLTAAELDGPGVSVRRVECGYYDAGAERGDGAALIQSACRFQYTQRTEVGDEENPDDPTAGHVMGGIIEAVPAGAVVEADTGWDLAARLLGGPGPSDDELLSAPRP